MKATVNHKRTNKKNGKKVMLVLGDNDNALVYVWCENYMRGGMHRRWCLDGQAGKSPKQIKEMQDNGMPIHEAVALFNKRSGCNFKAEV